MSDSLAGESSGPPQPLAHHCFTFLLDGLGDPRVTQALTRDVHARLGLVARADPAGLWLEVESPSLLDEALADRVAALTRRRGLELRDRIGATFSPSTTKEQLRARLAHEWASRFATGMVFLLPAIALHYLTPILAQGSTVIPEGIQAALVGWSIVAAAWPVAWQGWLSMRRLRMTPDVFALAAIGFPFGVSLARLVTRASPPAFHAAAFAILAVALQRAIVWRRAANLEGQAHRMLPSAVPLLVAFTLATAAAVLDQTAGMAVFLATPAMLGSLSINRLLPATSLLLPVLLFDAVLATSSLGLDARWLSGRIEAAFAFNIGITLACSMFMSNLRAHSNPDR